MEPKKYNIWNLTREYVESLLENTIETYPDEWRLIHEPLQNAIDSFIDEGTERPIVTLPAEPTVKLELKLGTNSVVVTDNGKGVSLDNFQNFLFLGGGTKGNRIGANARKLLKGSQGVGIKATVFTSDHFKIRTVCSGKYWEKELPNFSEYSDPSFTGEIEEPPVIQTNEPSGTQVELTLKDYSVFKFITDRVKAFYEVIGIGDQDFDESGNIILDGKKLDPLRIERVLMRYFKTQSYVGDVSRRIFQGDLPRIKFELLLNCDFSKEKEQEFVIKGFKPLKSGDLISLDDWVEYLDFDAEINKLDPKKRPKIVTNYKEILENGKKFDQPTVFSQILNKDDIIKLLGKLRKRGKNDPPASTENILMDDNSKIVEYYSAIYKVNGAILYIAPRPFNRRFLVHRPTVTISVNGLPTDISLEITGGALGYVPSVHFILDVNETLGYGKRNLPSRSKGTYTALMKELWRNIQRLASFIVAEEEPRDRTVEGIHFDRNLENSKIQDYDSREGKELMQSLGRCTVPETEEDVVSAYFFLAGKGLVYPYKFVRLNDRTVYDALSVHPSINSVPTPEQLITVEFKFSAKQLCESDEDGRQRFEDIQLAIVWKIGEIDDLPEYSYQSKEGDTSNFKYLPSSNYRLKHGRHSLSVICLEDILNERLGKG